MFEKIYWLVTPISCFRLHLDNDFCLGEKYKFYQLSGISKGYRNNRGTNLSISIKLDESGSEVAQSCPTLCDPVDCSLPAFSIHGIFQARVLAWGAISFSRGSSRPRNWTPVSCTAGFTLWASREALILGINKPLPLTIRGFFSTSKIVKF